MHAQPIGTIRRRGGRGIPVYDGTWNYDHVPGQFDIGSRLCGASIVIKCPTVAIQISDLVSMKIHGDYPILGYVWWVTGIVFDIDADAKEPPMGKVELVLDCSKEVLSCTP